MDLSHPQSNLSLGFHSHAADADSVPHSCSHSLPFQSLTDKPDNRSDDDEQSRGEQREKEFSMLSHPICPKNPPPPRRSRPQPPTSRLGGPPSCPGGIRRYPPLIPTCSRSWRRRSSARRQGSS
ncbi:serine hydroxymethyltransferase 7 isoform X1 [Iris pallida]|uniref:Serine hydroxymethyltransferase 7 isoform X1 n=1 Tax=Iris pallida TaxID=29817 RepID=A0AAX6H2V5_IRIPA|nr:serine hydroxymethyltransferase 7 isoform X1 [Iris pallida]KAJ6834968.1 serine hydroxymethyltransferase 7 isoform X1 [Iris pallida]